MTASLSRLKREAVSVTRVFAFDFLPEGHHVLTGLLPMLHAFRRHTAPLLPHGPRTIVAVSGGVDSMALLHLLLESQLIPGDHLIVAHFNHNLRPSASEDAAFVVQTAQTNDQRQFGRPGPKRPL